jgi:hypothetical protein
MTDSSDENKKNRISGLAVKKLKTKTLWPESASELYRPSDRRSSAKLEPIFADRWFHAVSVTNPYGCIIGFLDQSRYFFFFPSSSSIVLTRLSGPVPDPLLLRRSGGAGNRIRTSGSVARNSDHETTGTVGLTVTGSGSENGDLLLTVELRTLRALGNGLYEGRRSLLCPDRT